MNQSGCELTELRKKGVLGHLNLLYLITWLHFAPEYPNAYVAQSGERLPTE